MLGNWRFGDYFKEEAIEWSWELLTKVWKLDPTPAARHRLRGRPGERRPAATTRPRSSGRKSPAFRDDRIHYGQKDNFWEMGETGPCGPCTEIYIDRTPDKTGGQTGESGDDPRVMEIWNNVFIQYNRNADGR